MSVSSMHCIPQMLPLKSLWSARQGNSAREVIPSSDLQEICRISLHFGTIVAPLRGCGWICQWYLRPPRTEVTPSSPRHPTVSSQRESTVADFGRTHQSPPAYDRCRIATALHMEEGDGRQKAEENIWWSISSKRK